MLAGVSLTPASPFVVTLKSVINFWFIVKNYGDKENMSYAIEASVVLKLKRKRFYCGTVNDFHKKIFFFCIFGHLWTTARYWGSLERQTNLPFDFPLRMDELTAIKQGSFLHSTYVLSIWSIIFETVLTEHTYQVSSIAYKHTNTHLYTK